MRVGRRPAAAGIMLNDSGAPCGVLLYQQTGAAEVCNVLTGSSLLVPTWLSGEQINMPRVLNLRDAA